MKTTQLALLVAMRFCMPTLVVATILCSITRPSSAGPILVVDDPTNDGFIDIEMDLSVGGTRANTFARVLVLAEDTPESKAQSIRDAYNDDEVGVGLGRVFLAAKAPDEIEVIPDDITVITYLSVKSNGTGEFTDTINSNDDDVTVAEATFGDGPFSATDATGNENSQFRLGIVTEDPITGSPILLNAFASSDLLLANQGDLTGFSVATELAAQMVFQQEFLEQTFGTNFPYVMSVTEGSGIVSFDFHDPVPAGVSFGTSSPTGSVGASLTMVPEPSTSVLLPLLGVFATRWRRQR